MDQTLPDADALLQSFQNSRRLMTDLLNMLHEERASLARKLAGVDAAIHALNGMRSGVKVKKRTWKMSRRLHGRRFRRRRRSGGLRLRGELRIKNANCGGELVMGISRKVVASIFVLVFSIVVVASGEPPTGFRNFKWGASPRSTLKKFSGPTDEGLTMYVPLSKKPEPLYGIPVAEEDYAFVHGKFYQGDVFLDGEPNLQKMKDALVHVYGNPTFTNENLKIWKWNWPQQSIEIQLYFQAKFARTTATFSNSAIN